MANKDDKITLAVCKDTLKVGCVLIQAAYGCPTGIVSELFKPETWILTPVESLRPFTLTRQLPHS